MMISHEKRFLKRNDKSTTLKQFTIVAIGASDSSIPALELILKNTPSDIDTSIIIVMPVNNPQIIDDLRKHSQMPIEDAQPGIKIKNKKVYIASSDKSFTITNGYFSADSVSNDAEKIKPIDCLFQSLSTDIKRKIIGIILSGVEQDGAYGIRAIFGEGGLTIVEQNAAENNEIVKSAINMGVVDHVLTIEKIADFFVKYIKYSIKPSLQNSDGNPEILQKILLLVRAKTGHDFSAYKHNTIVRRIEKRMGIHQISNIITYLRYLQQHSQEITILFKEFLIGVTCFFRDQEVFEQLKNEVLPKMLISKQTDYSIRIWVAGCSSGEEAYSFAIILQECMDQLKRQFNVQIFATDIDEVAIERARAGIYPETIKADVTAERLKRFFKKEDCQYRINKDLRKMIIFAPQNIIKDPPFTKLDILSCRNLLIYINSNLQKKLIPCFHYSLKPNGILLLGSAENIGENVNLFYTINKKLKIFERKDGGSGVQAPMNFSSLPSGNEIIDNKPTHRDKKTLEFNISQLIEKILLKDYAPACVVINERNEILYVHGRTGKYLEPAPGKASLNILDMARPGLNIKLSAALRKAISQQQEFIYYNVQIKSNEEVQLINLRVRPLSENENTHKLMLVIFENQNIPQSNSFAKTGHTSAEKYENQIAELEQELKHSKENLQTTIEELETSNEELKSSNEELQSTNEELQSTNEEIETAKEELQSLNEELTTVNQELQHRIDQLSNANDDMINLLDSTDIATVFLDNDLCIKRFTPKATEVINLILSDIGRPISHIVTNLKYENLIEDANNVLKTLSTKIIEMENKDGKWYLIRINPYRTVTNKIDGIVITFLNIHEQKQAERKLLESKLALENIEKYAQSIFEIFPCPILVIDKELKAIANNVKFISKFDLSANNIKENNLSNLLGNFLELTNLEKLLRKMITSENIEDNVVINCPYLYKSGSVLIRVCRAYYINGSKFAIMLVFNDAD